MFVFTDFLQLIGLASLIPDSSRTNLNNLVEQAFSTKVPFLSDREISNLFLYQIPKFSPDGSCSIIDTPADKPYNLAATFGIESVGIHLQNHPQTIRLWRFKQIIDTIAARTQVDWFGIYRKIHRPNGQWILVKERYHGLFSRPEFPLTKEFATKSNNATVGLTGYAKVIHDVQVHQGPYYICDGKVQSEFCLPIVNDDREIIGIIDAEAWTKNFFTTEIVLQIAKVSFDLGIANLGITS